MRGRSPPVCECLPVNYGRYTYATGRVQHEGGSLFFITRHGGDAVAVCRRVVEGGDDVGILAVR